MLRNIHDQKVIKIFLVLSEAGFSAKSLSKEQLVEKRNQLLIDLWSYQTVIDQRNQFKLDLGQK